MKTKTMNPEQAVTWMVIWAKLPAWKAAKKIESINGRTGASFTHGNVTVTFVGNGYVGEK